MPINIFISYRQDDSRGETGRLADRLMQVFGRNSVFVDVSTIPLGVDFEQWISGEVSKCDVLLAVIGKQWLDLKDEHGNRRVDDARDFVRVEIAAALNRDIPVVPILLDGTKIPKAELLPVDIKGLAMRNGLDLRYASFQDDLGRLIGQLRELQRSKGGPNTASREGPPVPKAQIIDSFEKWILPAALAILLVSAIFIGYRVAPLLYAAAAFGLFHWLDDKLSDEAKAAVTSTMQSRGIEADRIVSALLEIFDRIYTYPLWSIRAFRRSTLLTIAAGVATLPIMSRLIDMLPSGPMPAPLSKYETYALSLTFLTLSLSVNILTDYVSLFFIRRWLRTAGKRPILVLMLGALIAALIVTIGNLLRNVIDVTFLISYLVFAKNLTFNRFDFGQLATFFSATFIFSIPALIVFVWLPLFAIGILVGRMSGPLFWAFGRTQWLLKDGQSHPLKAVACVAAVSVLGVGVILQSLL